MLAWQSCKISPAILSDGPPASPQDVTARQEACSLPKLLLCKLLIVIVVIVRRSRIRRTIQLLVLRGQSCKISTAIPSDHRPPKSEGLAQMQHCIAVRCVQRTNLWSDNVPLSALSKSFASSCSPCKATSLTLSPLATAGTSNSCAQSYCNFQVCEPTQKHASQPFCQLETQVACSPHTCDLGEFWSGYHHLIDMPIKTSLHVESLRSRFSSISSVMVEI